jgi:hypothetical protein
MSLRDVMGGLDERLGPFEQDVQWVGPALTQLDARVASGTVR